MNHLRQAISFFRSHLPRTDRAAWRGQSVVEFAIVAPLVLLILGAALDMGRLFYARVAIENAAREGAFYGSTNPRCDTSARSFCGNPDNADWRVRNEVTGLDSLNVSFTCSNAGSPVSVTSCQMGDMYQADVSTNFDFVTPLLMPILGGSMTLDASASAVVLEDAFDPNATPAPSPSAGPLCTVPHLIGMTSEVAENTWEAAGFDFWYYDDGAMKWWEIVATQSVTAGTQLPCVDGAITVGM